MVRGQFNLPARMHAVIGYLKVRSWQDVRDMVKWLRKAEDPTKGERMEATECTVPLDGDRMVAVHTTVEAVEVAGEQVLRVVKADKIDQFDENTYAKVDGIDFHNGIIEVKILSRLLPDAPDFARGFLGIVFRVNERDSEFESFYVRPTNGRSCADPLRRQHGCQYFSYPGYTFAYFREHAIGGYEAQTEIDLDEWIDLKAVVEDDRASFYVNDQEAPVLTVAGMKHGADARGAVGVYIDTGTEGFVKDLRVTCWD